MLGLMGFSGSLPLYVIHRYYIFVFIDRANKDACLLACTPNLKLLSSMVSDINRASQIFWTLSELKPPSILALKVVFGKLFIKLKLCTKFEVTGFNGLQK